ncbi:MAG: amine oxidase [Acidimicrobiia bacterium]
MSGAARSADVAVLGAGPAGLAAALGIARSGRSVVVVERHSLPGGLAGSFEVAGVRVDYGSHRLHPSCDPAILGELRRLLGADLQLRVRHGRIRLANRWVAFPPRAGDLVRRLPAPIAVRLASDALTAPLRRRGGDTFADVVRAGLGPTMLDELYGPYVEKLWGLPTTALDGELARRRVGARSPAALAGKLVRRGDRPGSVFFSPRRGYGQISDALAAAAADAGADLRFGADVSRVDVQGDRVMLTTATGERMDAALVASSIPVPALVAMGGDSVPVSVRDAAEALEFRGLVLVYLVLTRPRWTEFDAHYFPALDTLASRVSEPKNYRDGDDPEDVTVLCAEIPCTAGDATWSAPDDALAARVADDLARAGLDRLVPDAVTTRRVAKAYPTYRRGFAERFAAVDGWLAEQQHLVTFGRQGLFAHDNAHHALAMGWALAECLRPDGSLDRQRWRQAREGFRAHVVED